MNALSEWLVAEVRRDGKVYRQEFARGEPTTDMEAVGVSAKDESGTTISFLPDSEVFEETEFDAATLSQRLRETAFLTRGLRIVLRDERAGGKTEEFHYEGGIKDFVAHVNEAKDPVHKHIVYFEGESDEGAVEVAMQWNTRTSSRCSPLRTTSTRPRAARTCRAFGPRSRGRSTSTRARRASSRRRTTTSRARTSARGSPRSSP